MLGQLRLGTRARRWERTLNPFKRLASQTAIYGLSSIVGRFLNYLLVPLFTYTFTPAEYGVVSEFYAYMGFFSVALLFGVETGYFRFRGQDAATPQVVYATALRFVLVANALFMALIWLTQEELAEATKNTHYSQLMVWTAAILTLDAIGAVAFARLRAEERALRFAGIKLVEIGINVGLNLFFIVLCRDAAQHAPNSLLAQLWVPALGLGYIFLANLAASAVKLLLLLPQLRGIAAGFDGALLRRMLRYSLPMVIIGMAGIVNEMLDRALMKYLLPYDAQKNLELLGIYSACYKLSIVMTLFIQAFRYAAEPFFFAYAGARDAPQTYARVLTYFVAFCVFIFLFVTMYLDWFQYFVGEAFRSGLDVVPVLLLANLLLGIYVNLSVWYKLTDRTMLGAYVALVGAAITVILLVWWVPLFGYMGAAWATLVCYAVMVVVSYLLGRRYFPVPYNLKRVAGYIALGLVLYGVFTLVGERTEWKGPWVGSILLSIYLFVVYGLEVRPQLQKTR